MFYERERGSEVWESKRGREGREGRGAPRLVVHNIDGRMREIFGLGIDEAPPDRVLEVARPVAAVASGRSACSHHGA